MFRGTQRVVVLSLLAIALTSCTSTPSAAPTSAASAASEQSLAFASKAEAEKLFHHAYDSYLEVANHVAADGGEDVQRIRPLVTAAEYERESKAMAEYVKRDLRIDGDTQMKRVRLQSVDLESGEGTIYVCLDVSETRVVDKAGTDVTPSKRALLQSLVVTFAPGLLIDRSEAWSGDGVC